MHNIAPHEAIDIHELLVFKNTCITKTYTMIPLIKDVELKDIFSQEVDLSRTHIIQLKDIIEQVSFNNVGEAND